MAELRPGEQDLWLPGDGSTLRQMLDGPMTPARTIEIFELIATWMDETDTRLDSVESDIVTLDERTDP